MHPVLRSPMLKQFVHLLDRTQTLLICLRDTFVRRRAAYAVGLKKALKNDLSCQDVV